MSAWRGQFADRSFTAFLEGGPTFLSINRFERKKVWVQSCKHGLFLCHTKVSCSLVMSWGRLYGKAVERHCVEIAWSCRTWG